MPAPFWFPQDGWSPCASETCWLPLLAGCWSFIGFLMLGLFTFYTWRTCLQFTTSGNGDDPASFCFPNTGSHPVRFRYSILSQSDHKDKIRSENCCICLADLWDPKKIAVKTICGHTFHYQCIRNWVAVSPGGECPICRKWIRRD